MSNRCIEKRTRAPTAYNLFVKEQMPKMKVIFERNGLPFCFGIAIKVISALWAEQHNRGKKSKRECVDNNAWIAELMKRVSLKSGSGKTLPSVPQFTPPPINPQSSPSVRPRVPQFTAPPVRR